MLGVNVRPVAEPFTFTGRGTVTVRRGAEASLYGVCQVASGSGETLDPTIRLTAPPNGTSYAIQQPFTQPTRFASLTDYGDGSSGCSPDAWNSFGLSWNIPSNTSVPQSRVVNATATVDDHGDRFSQTIQLTLNVNP